MLLDLCDDLVKAESGLWRAKFNPDAYPFQRGEGDNEAGLSAFIIAEALAQIGCRTARCVLGVEARVLPAIVRDLAIDATTDTVKIEGGLLEATLVKERPVTQLACCLKDKAGHLVARATIIATALGKATAEGKR